MMNIIFLVIISFITNIVFSSNNENIYAVYDEEMEVISIFRENLDIPIIVQNTQSDIRPYLHPIIAPDGNGTLTEYRPGHHTHQTGIYWGLKEVNGRDYFMDCCRPGVEGYYRKLSSEILTENGSEVSWQTVYDLLDDDGKTVLTETKIWTLTIRNNKYYLDLIWNGLAKSNVYVEEFYVGGLFVRMPWYRGIDGRVINSVGQTNNEAETNRALWANVGMEIDSRDDWGNITVFDHKDNINFPTPWRVDRELGIGPSKQITGDWELDKGQNITFRFRLLIYTGEPDIETLNKEWHRYNFPG
jgi:hypothetical protein